MLKITDVWAYFPLGAVGIRDLIFEAEDEQLNRALSHVAEVKMLKFRTRERFE
jgi:hypothetical protein